MSARKQQLLEKLIDYLTAHGVAGISLRPMAAAVGTSARLLLFHFGSRERLLNEVVDEMQARLRRSAAELLARLPADSGVAPLRHFWDWALEERNLAHLRVLYQLHILAAQDQRTHARYLKRNSRDWLELVQSALKPAHRSSTLATLIVATFDGLLIEVMSTGDRRRASAAMDEFIAMARRHLKARRPSRKSAVR